MIERLVSESLALFAWLFHSVLSLRIYHSLWKAINKWKSREASGIPVPCALCSLYNSLTEREKPESTPCATCAAQLASKKGFFNAAPKEIKVAHEPLRYATRLLFSLFLFLSRYSVTLTSLFSFFVRSLRYAQWMIFLGNNLFTWLSVTYKPSKRIRVLSLWPPFVPFSHSRNGARHERCVLVFWMFTHNNRSFYIYFLCLRIRIWVEKSEWTIGAVPLEPFINSLP